jgi:4-amino-4-deoxy-L-arabinose transferase-like glycosyltransferase
MIWASCRVLGDTEFAVRLPVVIASAFAAWGVGRLAMKLNDGDERVGLLSVVIFLLLPAFQANAQICTQDGPLIALWIALAAIGLRLFHRWAAGQSTWADWMLMWSVLGIGTLFKQSILLFLPSLAIFWFLQRRRLPLSGRLVIQQLVGALLFTLIISPMIIWNAGHGWPMLAHTLGHLGAGGDQLGRVNRGNPLSWFSVTLGGIAGAFGPAAIVLMCWACWHAYAKRWADQARWRDQLWLMCAAWPSVIFFLLLSLTKPVLASWPLVSFGPLVVLMAQLACSKLEQGDVWFRRTWSVLWIWGLVAWIVISFPTMLAYAPFAGKRLQSGVLNRMTGHRADAAALQSALAMVKTPDGRPPLIVARHYMMAGLDSFYLPDHPSISTAGKYLAKRSTTFDQWSDTNLENPELHGRTLLLIGEGDVPWERGLIFDHREPLACNGELFFIATNYQGPRPDYPRENGPRAGDD